MSIVSRRLGATLGSVGLALATAAVVTAGPASAMVDSVTVKPGLDGKIATTCTHEIKAVASGNDEVRFWNGPVLLGKAVPVNGAATIQWTPTLPGVFTISAEQDVIDAKSTLVTVVPGLNLGSLCFGLA